MRLSELLLHIDNIAKRHKISKPFIVGGVPRDKLLGLEKYINDIDITTGDKSIHQLAKYINIYLNKQISSYKVMPNGYYSIKFGDISIDLSGNFIIPGIQFIFNKKLTNMQKELFSRDFTCNTLLMTLDLKEILDLTEMGLRDIKSKIIRTNLPPQISLGYNNKAIIRVLYLSAKLNFSIDPKVLEWIKKNSFLIKNIPVGYSIAKINKALEYNRNRVIEFIGNTNIWSIIPKGSNLDKLVRL